MRLGTRRFCTILSSKFSTNTVRLFQCRKNSEPQCPTAKPKEPQRSPNPPICDSIPSNDYDYGPPLKFSVPKKPVRPKPDNPDCPYCKK